ncbi:MAG: hypothetical protein EOP51_31540 [Sphingobacteriales bacterium]|nr:MAG: hypothetical protein EOP51_31540 [Sphingobacteriales bacterium]
MSKTLHTKTTHSKTVKTAEEVKPENNTEQLIELMQDMKAAWNDASADLLQPRDEAIAQLLRKVLH